MKEFNAGCYFLVDAECAALTVKECPKDCGFYKTPEQFEAARGLANDRLNSLPTQKQVQIADTYHAGKMPWRT